MVVLKLPRTRLHFFARVRHLVLDKVYVDLLLFRCTEVRKDSRHPGLSKIPKSFLISIIQPLLVPVGTRKGGHCGNYIVTTHYIVAPTTNLSRMNTCENVSK